MCMSEDKEAKQTGQPASMVVERVVFGVEITALVVVVVVTSEQRLQITHRVLL